MHLSIFDNDTLGFGPDIYDWRDEMNPDAYGRENRDGRRPGFVPIGRGGYSDEDVPVGDIRTTATGTPDRNRNQPTDWDKQMKKFTDWIEAHKTEAMLGAVVLVVLLTRK